MFNPLNYTPKYLYSPDTAFPVHRQLPDHRNDGRQKWSSAWIPTETLYLHPLQIHELDNLKAL